jgi:NAD(P)-dependent dehydrogenase (short-subunit alcohol dehydrogenase family)
MDIAGNTALVTGGAGGLGEATVRRLVEEGARVVISDLSEEKGRALEAELGDAVVFAKTNVLDEDSVGAAVAAAEELGDFRILVTAHGGPTALRKIVDRSGEPMPQASFDRTVSLYLSGVFNVMRQSAAAIARTEERDGGRGVLINTASVAAFEAQIGQADYAAAKGGIVGLGLASARDLASWGIRVMTIAPGIFYTPAWGDISKEQGEEIWGKVIPHPRRMGVPAEYAELVASIIRNDYLNGDVIRLDGALRFAPK